MDGSARIPLIDETARREDEKPEITALGYINEDDIRKVTEDLTLDNAASILHQHARDGKVGPLNQILRKFGEDIINAVDEDGLTALHFAARYGRVDVVRDLLQQGANGNAQTREGYTPLHMTAKYCRSEPSVQTSREHMRREEFAKASSRSLPGPRDAREDSQPAARRIISLLIRNGVFPDTKNDYSMTPLHYAAMKDNRVAAETLIEMGARVNPDDTSEMSPLLTACVYGSQNVVELLLDKGGDISAFRASDKSTAFHIAAQHGKTDTLRSLLNKARTREAVFLRMANNEGNTPLCLAVEGGYVDTIKLLLSKMKTIDTIGREQWVLHVAASRGYLEVIKILIKYGAKTDRADANHRLPVHLSAKNNHGVVTKYLVQIDPDSLGARDELGLTPLLLAASYKEASEAVSLLIEDCGAKIDDTDHENRSVVYIAAKYNAAKTLLYLLERLKAEDKKNNKSTNGLLYQMVNQYDHNQNTPMHVVCSNGYLESVQKLKEFGAELDCLNEDEETPLHLAAARGRTETVRQLLEWDKRLVMHKDEMGNTPLHLAARNGHDVAVKVLLDNGADKETRNEREETPLDAAVGARRIDCVRLLVQQGAVVEKENSSMSPLHLAAELGDEDMVRFLLRCNVDIASRNDKKMTALELAIRGNHQEVARALVENEKWKHLMTTTEHIPVRRHKEARQTPMRDLIKFFPDVAGLVFDKCITVKEDGKEYDFSLLEDTFMIPKKGEKAVELHGELDPFLESGRLKPGARMYTTDTDVLYRNHPLKMIAASERMSLLGHPLVLALIKQKWNSLGRIVYYFALAIYLVFITLFTTFVVRTPAPYNVINEEGVAEDFSELLENADASCEVTVKHPGPFFKYAIIVLSACQMIKEVIQMVHRRIAYISAGNFLEWVIYVSAILTVWDFNDCSEFTGVRTTMQWRLAAVCAFLSWMNLLVMIRKLPRFGIYVVMFFDIVRTFSRFFLIFALFILAFSITFFIILQNRPEFSSLTSSVLKTTVMMIGEFEFTSIFHGDPSIHTEKLFGLDVAYPLFFLFCLVMTILLMNLLVGLAVDDIKAVQEKAELRRLSMQVDLVLQIEATIPWMRQKVIRGRYRVFKNPNLTVIGRTWRKVTAFFGFQASVEEEVTVVKTEEEELMMQLREEQRAQGAQVANLQANIDVMYEKQLELENMIRLLLNRSKLEYRVTDPPQQTR